MLTAQFDAELNAAYLEALQRRIESWDLWLRILIAVAGCAVAVGAIVERTTAWHLFSGITNLFSASIVPLLKWQKLVGLIEADRMKWTELKNDWAAEVQEADESDDWVSAAKAYKRLKKTESRIEAGRHLHPKHNRLYLATCRAVRMRHGCEE